MMELPAGSTGLGTQYARKRTIWPVWPNYAVSHRLAGGDEKGLGEIREKDRFETMGAAIQISWVATYFAG